jgi:serine/threonine-protein kinase RsbT
LSIEAGLSLVDQTRIVTAASELARNMIDYAGGGSVVLDIIGTPPRRGVRLIFEDRGPGIANIELAMKDGYTTGGGLGLGLGGAKRLASEFVIQSKPGEGTKVMITRWK